MPRTNLAIQNEPESADLTELVLVNCDPTNQNEFVNTGREVLFIQATVGRVVRVTHNVEGQSRQRDYTLVTGQRVVLPPFPKAPFNAHPAAVDPTKVYIDIVGAVAGDIQFAVIREARVPAQWPY
jgi:hypothetical protein